MADNPKLEHPEIAFIALHAVANGYVIHEHLARGGVRTKVYASLGQVAVAIEAIDPLLVREQKPETLSTKIEEALVEAGKAFGVDAGTLKTMAKETITEGFMSFFGIGKSTAPQGVLFLCAECGGKHALGTTCPPVQGFARP